MEICRLCQGKPKENEFRKLLDPYKCIINNVIPEANLDTPHNPIICNPCSSVIDELNNFKLQCHDAQKKLMDNSTEKNYNLPINQILPNVTAEKICRTCLHPMECDTFTKLKPSSPDAYLESMLSLCLPDLKLNLTDDPIMCEKCFKTLQKFHQLKTTCLDVEEKLKDGENGSADVKDEEMVEKEAGPTFMKVGGKLDDIMKEVLKRHNKDVHYSCGECAFTMPNKRHYVMHMLMTHTTYNDDHRKKHFCYLCDHETDTKEKLKRHIEANHLPTDKLCCPFCNFSSNYTLNLRRHIQIHEDMQDLVCSHPMCDFKTSYKYSLQRHEMKMHANQCAYCEFKNKTQSTLQKHYRTVHNTYEIWSCDKCSFKSYILSLMKKHYTKEHKGLKPNFVSVKKKHSELSKEEQTDVDQLFKD